MKLIQNHRALQPVLIHSPVRKTNKIYCSVCVSTLIPKSIPCTNKNPYSVSVIW